MIELVQLINVDTSLQDCPLHLARDVLDKRCVIVDQVGFDAPQIQIQSIKNPDECWLTDLAGRIQGHVFRVPLSTGSVFEGEVYLRAVPIIVDDLPCSAWITCTAVWSFLFGDAFDSERIGKTGRYVPASLARMGVSGCNFRRSKKSLEAASKAEHASSCASVWISGEQQFSFSVVGLIAWLLEAASGRRHWNLSDDERARSEALCKGIIDVSVRGTVCFRVCDINIVFEDGKLDVVAFHHSQKAFHKGARLHGVIFEARMSGIIGSESCVCVCV